jgi:hypothetical protein
MVLVYQGNVERLTREVEEVKDAVNQRYLEVLGQERYDKLDRTVKRILGPSSFIDSTSQLKRIVEEDFKPNTPSKFLFAMLGNTSTDKKGNVKAKSCEIACGFYITEESFENSDSRHLTDKIVASYIHEYNHFVPMVLQRTPLYMAEGFLREISGKVYSPNDAVDLVDRLNDNPRMPDHEKIKILLAGTFQFALRDMWENATRILDKMILQSIGIEQPLIWRGSPRMYKPLFLENPNVAAAIPVNGDPFLHLSDEEVIRRLIDWPNYFNPMTKHPFIDNLLDSMKSVSVNYYSINELDRISKKRKKKGGRK